MKALLAAAVLLITACQHTDSDSTTKDARNMADARNNGDGTYTVTCLDSTVETVTLAQFTGGYYCGGPAILDEGAWLDFQCNEDGYLVAELLNGGSRIEKTFEVGGKSACDPVRYSLEKFLGEVSRTKWLNLCTEIDDDEYPDTQEGIYVVRVSIDSSGNVNVYPAPTGSSSPQFYNSDAWMACHVEAMRKNRTPIPEWQSLGACSSGRCAFSHPFLRYELYGPFAPTVNHEADKACRRVSAFEGGWKMPSYSTLKRVAKLRQAVPDRFSDFVSNPNQWFWDVHGNSSPYQAVNLESGRVDSNANGRFPFICYRDK